MASLRLVRLTEHERSIVQLYARGVRGQRLAEAKGISYHTVRSHYERICQKCGERDMISVAIRMVEENRC